MGASFCGRRLDQKTDQLTKVSAAGSPTAGFDEVLSRVAGGRQNTALQAAVPRSSPTPPATESHRVAAPVVKLLPEQQVDEEFGLAKPERQKSREEAPRAPAASHEVTALESVPAALQAALGQALQGAALQVPQHALVEAPQNTGYQGFARSEPARPVRDARLEALMQPAFPPPSRSLAHQLDAKSPRRLIRVLVTCRQPGMLRMPTRLAEAAKLLIRLKVPARLETRAQGR